MKKLLLFLGVFLISSAMLMAQQTVTGRVTDAEDGSPLPGVNILEKGTTNGTVTDIDGNYTVNVSGDAILVFSFVGYVAQEIPVNQRTSIDVGMAPDVTQLSEVVVVGYGTQEKKEITSAVASVGSEDFNNGNVTDPAQLIQGKVAGLSITRAGGNPNSGFNIRLRGLSTFGANTSPLVVIDGVIGASLDNLDPNDIETIDVLKDGSAAAIYGARGSAGVILVTTKSGKGAGETSFVDFNGFVTIDNVANTIPVLSAQEYLDEGGTDFGSDTDWVDELTQTGVSYTGNLAFGGSSSTNSSYRASVNYRNNEGVAINTGFERVNTRLQLNQNALDGRLRFQVNASYNERSDDNVNNEAFRYAIIYNPTAPIYEDPQENPGRIQDYGPYFQRDLFDFYNPVALINQQDFYGERTNILLNGRVEYDLLPNLTLAVNYGQDRLRGFNSAFWSKQDFASGFGSGGRARKDQYNSFNEILTGTAQFNTELINDLDFQAMVGAETQIRKADGFGVMARNFLFDYTGAENLAFASIRDGVNTDLYSYRNKNTLNSAFARVNFNYDNTFFFSASLRAESWSGFGEDEKTGFFPAVSAGADLSNIFDMGAVSLLKLRASYGVTGQLPPSSNLALPVWAPSGRVDIDEDPDTNNDLFVVPGQTQDPNPTLKWEVKKEINVGVDFGFFDDRWTGSIDWYTRNIEDLLYGLSISRGATNPFDGRPANAGFVWANIGELTAGGLEFATSYNGVRLGPVTWTPSFNMTWYYQKTKIETLQLTEDIGIPQIQLGNLGSPGQNETRPLRAVPGELVGDIYGPRYLGVDEQGQYVLSADINDPDSYERIGNGLPEFELGFANSFVFGNFDFNFFLRGTFGHDLINSYRNFYEARQSNKTWNFVNTDKADTRIVATPTFSSLYVEDASFLRLDNAQLGYSFPMASSSAFSKLRLYVAGQNLFTITNYAGIDPEFRPTDTENGDGFQTNLAPGIERRGTYFTVTSFTFGVTASLR